MTASILKKNFKKDYFQGILPYEDSMANKDQFIYWFVSLEELYLDVKCI